MGGKDIWKISKEFENGSKKRVRTLNL